VLTRIQSRAPISARLVANMLQTAGANRMHLALPLFLSAILTLNTDIVTVDLHASQVGTTAVSFCP
jgi:phosphoribosylpyrophosphate synthetase